jgi:hypothetical protein
VRALAFDRLGLRGLTLVGQDCGLIGLPLVAEHPNRFARVVAAIKPHACAAIDTIAAGMQRRPLTVCEAATTEHDKCMRRRG